MMLLKFACNSDLGPKKMVAWSVNNNFVLQKIKTDQKCNLHWQCIFHRTDENYARDDESCQQLCYHNPDLLKLF